MTQKNGYYIPLYCALRDDPKLIRTAREFGIKDKDLLRAKLENMWTWAMMQRPDGVIEAEMSEEDFAGYCSWTGDPKKWVKILVDRGWLNRQADGSLKIHEWELYGGKLLQAVEFNRLRVAAGRDEVVRAFDRCQIPGQITKYNAIQELRRQGIKDETIIASAADDSRQSWDFWSHVKSLTPNHNETGKAVL